MISIDDWRQRAIFSSFGGHEIATWSSQLNDGDQNQKPWLLLIHGYPTSSWDWNFSWAALEEHFNLAAIDMLGFGFSAKPPRHHYKISEQADLQEALLEHLHVKDAHVFTHDYGNTVGQELLARQHAGTLGFSIKSMCFLNGGLFPEQHRARLLQKLGLTPLGPLLGMMLSKDQLRTSFDEIFGPETKASEAEIDSHWRLISENHGAKVLHRLLQYIPERKQHRERWVGALKTADVPLRLIDGGFDPVSGKHLYDYYKEILPSPDAVLFPEIGHYPHTEDTASVVSYFFDFHRNVGTIK